MPLKVAHHPPYENAKMHDREDINNNNNHNDNEIERPKSLQNIEELAFNNDKNDITVPFFFHVPATAGTLMQNMLSTCYNKVQVSNFYHHNNNTTEPLQILSTDNGIKCINMNTEVENDVNNRGIGNN